ncbi:MAG: glycoside hydrolase family 3 C-terminal domain-containing protein [Clostridiaceae bacterium]
MNKWQRLMYQPSLPLYENKDRVTASYNHRTLSKNAAKEGMVLIKNKNNLLPLPKTSKVALFGKATFDYIKGGGGSGDVTVEYTTNIYEGMKQLNKNVNIYESLATFYKSHVENEYKKGNEPGLIEEPSIPNDLLMKARCFTDTAIISISRFSGEGWDRTIPNQQHGASEESWVEKHAVKSNSLFENGDFYLSKNEKEMIKNVENVFTKIIIVLNVGGVIDTNWFVNDDKIQSVLMAWQGGIEGGLAAAELICGIGNPCGKLVDTFSKAIDDYPSSYNFHDSIEYVDYTDDIYVGYRYFETIPKAKEKVNYPFGYGLSYTTFHWQYIKSTEENNEITINIDVTNTGNKPGKEVFQVYSMPPQGLLGKPIKNLIAFKKTRLLKTGETQQISLSFNIADLASYDDLGKIKKSAYIIEKGEYNFFLGTSVRDGVIIEYNYKVIENRVILQLSKKLSPTSLKKRLLSNGSYELLSIKEANDPNENLLDRKEPEELEGFAPQTRYRGIHRNLKDDRIITLMDVFEGKATLEELISQMSDDELAHLLGGQPNTGVANTFGFGNLPEYGIPNVMTADGPAGCRINKECGVNTTAWPCSTLLACTWNDSIIFQVGEAGAKEVKENNMAIWLTPAVNIHRSPLCGRNFEYYSEDPLVAGKLAAAMVRGIQSVGISSAVKHFALNNKETNRKNSDSRVSERAAREIYLKCFEIIVKEANPWCIMSSYNIINGYRSSENKELLEDILRDEWGFQGVVTSDWWTYGEHYKEVKAGNDIKMGCGYPERLLLAMEAGALTREDMETSAKRLLKLIINLD